MIRLVKHGNTIGRPLLAIPGIDGSSGSIAPLIAPLSCRRPVVLVDYREDTSPTLESLVAEVAATIRRDLPEPVDVLGQSIGTIVAAQLAGHHHPLPVRRVVLIGPFTRARWGALRISNLATQVTPNWLYRRASVPLMRLVCGPVGDGGDHPFFTAVRRSDPKRSVIRTAWQIGRDFSTEFEGIHQPTLILMGEQDRFVPDIDDQVRVFRGMFSNRQARIETIPEAGHVLLPSVAISTAVGEIERFLA